VELDGVSSQVLIETRAGETTASEPGASSPRRSLRILASGSDALVLIDGRVVALTLGTGERRGVALRGRHLETQVSLASRAAERRPSSLAADGALRAPMPGRVVAVRAAVGDEVAAGAALVVVEAMKMQNELLAPRAGKVQRVLVKEGDTVERGMTLMELA
jgi:biotin carboxyl carrier protein